ncbi:hypothetical protein BJX70DRAFT_395903 [Aspergillus crustosus]
MSGVSKACCTIPPVIAKGYQPKGEYKTINGLKTYVTGPETATKAILVIYDIFGFFPQTLQGADILSTSSTQKYRVFIPDFFEGEPADITWFPPQTNDHKAKLGNFFQTKAAPPKTLSKIPGVVSEANALAPSSPSSSGSFASWSILGFCWGGKITTLASDSSNKTFKTAIQAHPAMLDPADAKQVNIPMALLASKDENPEDVAKFGANLQKDHYVETFPDQIHGWMAARSDLEDDREERSTSKPPRRKLPSRTHSEAVKKTQEAPDDSDISCDSSEYELTRKDIEMIFSGAPYFLLEKGKQEEWYPHVIFPFDDHDPSIQSLWDRRRLPYSSYTLSTLHAHLPVPKAWLIEGDTPVQLNSWTQTGSPRRASLDLGMYETPNMLSMNGKEPGSIGFHYFLEMPVADSVRFVGPPKASAEADFVRLSSLPAMTAYELMEHRKEPYGLCVDGTVHDRKQLLLEGPDAWKSIGVRNVDLRHLMARMQTLKDLRHDILHGEAAKTILDLEGVIDMYSGLFNNFLYPPPRFMTVEDEGPHSILTQIKALTTVLATPGAWYDFNLPEWRLRIGQILWERPPHGEGDFLNVPPSDKPWVSAGLERKWFLLQMILAAELLLRLDATVRVGLLRASHDLRISARDIQYFKRLRTSKVNWDMIAVRRLMDSFNFEYSPQADINPIRGSDESPSEAKVKESAWACNLTPEHVDRQIQGLLLFAESIGWPRIGELKEHFRSICRRGASQKLRYAFNQGLHNHVAGDQDCGNAMYSRSITYRPVLLRSVDQDSELSALTGWLTRTWLAGLVLPGSGICHLLMACLLENDANALATLGPIMNLYGGFSYAGKSWWSQECIVGRVLASLPGTDICMGWIGSDILPKEPRTSNVLDNTWFEVDVQDPPPCPGGPRIKQGKKISLKSTPVGLGDLTSGAFSLPVDSPDDQFSKVQIDLQSLAFEKIPPRNPDRNHALAAKPLIVFALRSGKKSLKTVSFHLTYNVRYISSHECRPPGSLVLYSAPSKKHKRSSSNLPMRRQSARLPGHPLHRSYSYEVVPIGSLPDKTASENRATNVEFYRALMWHKILVLDARGSPEQEAFARAWCASVGYHAIVGRVGRTCLACCIREARAVKVRVVIRVGDERSSRPSSTVSSRTNVALDLEQEEPTLPTVQASHSG